MEHFDIFIIGGGAAGLTAAIYAARSGKKTAIAEGNNVGGIVNEYRELANYPGIADRSPKQLIADMRIQAEGFGAQFIFSDVSGVSKSGGGFTVYTQTTMYTCSSVIIATGVKRKSLPFFDKHLGHGVSYCATCDGFFYKGKTVAVYGSGYTAQDDTLYLSGLCEKVYLINPKPDLIPSSTLQALKSAPNVHIISHASVVSLQADSEVTALDYVDNQTKAKHTLDVSGVFVALGFSSSSPLIYGISQNDRNEIITENIVNTSIDGVFAAGDCTDSPLKQVVTACAQGALAAERSIAYIAQSNT